jgi:hypothetical protein
MLWKDAVEEWKKSGLTADFVHKPIKKRVRALLRGVKKDIRTTTNTFVLRTPGKNGIILYRKNVKTTPEEFYNTKMKECIQEQVAARLVAVHRA